MEKIHFFSSKHRKIDRVEKDGVERQRSKISNRNNLTLVGLLDPIIGSEFQILIGLNVVVFKEYDTTYCISCLLNPVPVRSVPPLKTDFVGNKIK